MKQITDTNVIQMIDEAKLPMVIKFEAAWCAPCKAMTPAILDLEKEFDGKVLFRTANVEHCSLMAQRYRVTQIPALMVLDKGVMTALRVGAASKSDIRHWMVQSIPSLSNER